MIHSIIYTDGIDLLQSFLVKSVGKNQPIVSGDSNRIDHAEVILGNNYGSVLLLRRQAGSDCAAQRILLEVSNLDTPRATAIELQITLEEEYFSPLHGRMLRFLLPDLVEVVFIELLQTDTDMKRSAAQLYLCWIRQSQLPKPDEETETTSDTTTAPSMASIPSLPVLPKPPVAKLLPSWDPPHGSILPNLRTKVLHDGVLRPMFVNTTTPVPFNTDLFEGKVLLAVNSAAETREPFVSMFQANKQVKFELQVQGKFKRVPDGPIFFGGEITKKMELGMITRGICGGLLQMGRAVNAYMHHSFGDTKNVELPHITGPFWSSVDRLNITPVGQTPPPFLESFPEEAKARAARKANPEYTVNVDLGATYSFSLKTSKMDLEEWAIATSSYTKSMNLSMFWADADLRFVCYCVPANTPGIEYNSHGLPKLHPQDKISHFFSLEIQHISNHTDWAEETIESDGLGRPISVENMQLLQATLPVYQEKHERYQGYESVRLHATQLAGIFEQDLDDTSPRMSLASVGSVLSNDDTEETTEFHDAVLGPEELFEIETEPVTAREFDFEANSDRNTKIPFPPMDTDTSLQESTEEVSALLREKLSLLQDRIMTHSAKHLQEHKSEPFPKKKANLLGEPMIISTKVKRSLVAAVLEVDDDRSHKKGKRRTLYAFLANPADLATDCESCADGGVKVEIGPRRARKFVLRSFGEWKKTLPVVKQRVIPPCQSRYSDDLKRKASLTWSYETVLLGREHAATRTELARFLADTAHNEAFLAPNDRGVGSKRLRESLPAFVRESLVCVQQSNYYWSQECMGLCAEELVFIKPSKLLGTAVRLRIPITDIISVRKVTDGDHPLPIPGFHCLMVATFARQYTILVRGLDERDGWLAALQSQSYQLTSPARRRTSSSDTRDSDFAAPLSFSTLKRASSEMINQSYTAGTITGTNASMAFAALPASHLEGMISYPPDWNLGDKMILNGRNFTCSGVYHQLSLRTLELGKLVNDPCKLVAKLLEMAFKLSSEEPGAAEVSVWVTEYAADRPPDLSEPIDFQSLWVDFMDGVSLLQCIDLSEMDKTSPEATCLFLNLYHCLLIHAYLVVGLPNSLFKWSNFFRFCSYEAFGDIFSLAELEHCILRGAMSRPSINFLAQHFLIPNVEYSFALQIRDYRLLWGIFCGATSNMSEIPIYTPEDLDKQLDAIIRLSLAAEVKFKDDHSVVLPVPCQLFSKEFDPSYQVAATPKQVLSVLVQHLSGEQRAAARTLIARKGPLSVKYTPFNFQCKYPTRLSDATLRAAMESCDSFDAADSLGLGQMHV